MGKTLLVTADPDSIVRGPHPAFETSWPQARGVLKIVRGDTPARLDALTREWSALCGTELGGTELIREPGHPAGADPPGGGQGRGAA